MLPTCLITFLPVLNSIFTEYKVKLKPYYRMFHCKYSRWRNVAPADLNCYSFSPFTFFHRYPLQPTAILDFRVFAVFIYIHAIKVVGFCTKSCARERVINVKLSRCMPNKHWGDVECSCKGGWWAAPRPSHFRPGKKTVYLLYRRLGGPHGTRLSCRPIPVFWLPHWPLGYIFPWLMPGITHIHLFLVTKQPDYTVMDLTLLQTCSFP